MGDERQQYTSPAPSAKTKGISGRVKAFWAAVIAFSTSLTILLTNVNSVADALHRWFGKSEKVQTPTPGPVPTQPIPSAPTDDDVRIALKSLHDDMRSYKPFVIRGPNGKPFDVGQPTQQNIDAAHKTDEIYEKISRKFPGKENFIGLGKLDQITVRFDELTSQDKQIIWNTVRRPTAHFNP
jgi:hypothetical protein